MKAVIFGCILLLGISASAMLGTGCGSRTDVVVVYTSVDDLYAKEIFAAFTKETGIRVLPVFDTEEAKTLGLVHRIIAEKAKPQCDVFWSGEAARTVRLKKEGTLQAYRPSSAQDIPARWRDPEDRWTGFSLRSRVIVYNTKLVKDPPQRLAELRLPRWKGRLAMANPVFGTTATHVAMLSQLWGEEPTLKFLRGLKENEIRVVGGNSHVRDLVARGDCEVGLTDTDDVHVGIARGDPIAIAPTENDLPSFGLIPNTCALIQGAPHPDNGRRFLDWLLRPQTEKMLLDGPAKQLPVRMLPKETVAPEIHWDRLTDIEPLLFKAKEALGL